MGPKPTDGSVGPAPGDMRRAAQKQEIEDRQRPQTPPIGGSGSGSFFLMNTAAFFT